MFSDFRDAKIVINDEVGQVTKVVRFVSYMTFGPSNWFNS